MNDIRRHTEWHDRAEPYGDMRCHGIW